MTAATLPAEPAGTTAESAPDGARMLSGYGRDAGHRATGLVVEGDRRAEWHDAADTDGLIVLSARDHQSWQALRTRWTAALSPETGHEGRSTLCAGTLRALADAVAAAVRATVIVTDERLDVLAHHVTADAGGTDAQEWIVRRAAPASIADQLPPGGLSAQWTEAPILRLGGPRTARWSVAPVHAGGAAVGGIWLVGPHDPGADPFTAAVLRRATRRAAQLIAPHADPAEPAPVRPAGLLTAALRGTGTVDVVADALGFADDVRVQLLALLPPAGQRADRLTEFARLHAEAATAHGAVAAVDDRVYALLPAGDPVAAMTWHLERAATGDWAAVRCAISDPLGVGDELARPRAEVDRLLDIVADVAGPVIATVSGSRSHLVIAEIAELARCHAGLAAGPVQRLAEIDAAGRSDYLRTLRAYFQMGHDLQRAADRLYVHRNTLRYRLERIRILTGLDVNDPVAQLVADLQLRMHDMAAPASRAAPMAPVHQLPAAPDRNGPQTRRIGAART